MAIDTRVKRASVMGVGRPWMRSVQPDALKGVQWRRTVGNTYAGDDSIIPSMPGIELSAPDNRLHFAATGPVLQYSQADHRIHLDSKGTD